jgi:hypothetical protein
VHQHRAVFLTSGHVLFAAGAARHDPVWRVDESAGRRNYLRLGSALHGKCGIVRFRGDDYYVDCAIGALDEPIEGEPALAADSPATVKRGDRVLKSGAATGSTRGIIVDPSYHASADGVTSADRSARQPAPRQLLIRCADRRPFAEEGDSGALIFNEANMAIGLLWGTTTTGESVACPIGPVLHALNIKLCRTGA